MCGLTQPIITIQIPFEVAGIDYDWIKYWITRIEYVDKILILEVILWMKMIYKTFSCLVSFIRKILVIIYFSIYWTNEP